ncbi:hypothetical protein EB75_14320 [Mycobacterium sp. ST-F2]|nr:hypothetical protein EB75_14320 [Mycobacterium sp. ST-F2]
MHYRVESADDVAGRRAFSEDFFAIVCHEQAVQVGVCFDVLPAVKTSRRCAGVRASGVGERST